MPLIDLHCYFGVTPETLASGAGDAANAKAYADTYGVDVLCFSAPLASTDGRGGAAFLNGQLASDPRFRGWLTLSIHQPEQASELARKYLVKPAFCGTLLEQGGDADAITTAGGRDALNALRRYSKPVFVTVNSPATLHAVVEAAREFAMLKFFVSPQSEYLTQVAVAAMKDAVNTLFVPVAAFAERDVVANAVAVLGERRVAWASDWGRFHPAAALGMIRDSALGAPQRERVGLRNARDVLI
jgi:predicted TIM-barrel fold metal-dependent hydrolase